MIVSLIENGSIDELMLKQWSDSPTEPQSVRQEVVTCEAVSGSL